MDFLGISNAAETQNPAFRALATKKFLAESDARPDMWGEVDDVAEMNFDCFGAGDSPLENAHSISLGVSDMDSAKLEDESGSSSAAPYGAGSGASDPLAVHQLSPGAPLIRAKSSQLDLPEGLESVPKHIKVRETNKRAQARYRERQKRLMETFRAKVADLTEQLNRVQSENACLKMKNAQLERNKGFNEQPFVQGQEAFLVDLKELWRMVFPNDAATMSDKDFQQLSIKKFLLCWKELTVQMAKLLMDGAEDPKRPSHVRLHELVTVWRKTILHLVAIQPRLIMRIEDLLHRNITANGEPVNSHKLVELLDMTPEQKATLVGLYRVVTEFLRRLREERQAIMQELQSTTPSVESNLEAPHCILISIQWADKLKQNVEAEEHALLQFALGFRCEILTPLQEAVSNVHLFPRPLNAAAIYMLVKDEIEALGL